MTKNNYESCRRRDLSPKQKANIGRLSPETMAELQPLFDYSHNLEADPYTPFPYINSQ